MKKLLNRIKFFVSTLLLLFIGNSCSDNSVDIEKPTSVEYEELFRQTRTANLNFFSNVDVSQSIKVVNEETFQFMTEKLNKQFHDAYLYNGLAFDTKILKPLSFDNLSNIRTSEDITEKIKAIDDHLGQAFYSQMTAINEVVLSNEKQLDQVNIEEFITQVEQNTALSYEEGMMLISYLSSLESSIEFLNNGGIDELETQINQQLEKEGYNVSGRIQRCRVNTRDVLIGGIYGLAGGAVTGAIYGGTAGTFTVPILGTATGAVGGAVFGGAYGFVTGVVGSVVTQLMSTCTRHTGYEAASCKRLTSLYYSGLINSLPNCAFNLSDLNIKPNISRSMGRFFSLNQNLVR